MLHDKLRLISQKNKGTSKAIAEYLLSNSTNLSLLDVKDVARETYTSQASVIRLVQKLRFSKWRYFVKEYIREQTFMDKLGTVNVNLPFSKNSTTNEVIDNVSALEIESIKNTQYLLNTDDVNKIVEIIENSNRIVIFSLQPNYYMARSFKRKMLSIGKNIEVAEDGQFGLKAASLDKNDCAIIVSYSGSEFIGSVTQVKKLRKNMVKTIAITSESNNFLIKNLDYQIEIPTNEHLSNKIANYASEISVNFIFDILFSVIFKYSFEDNLNYKIVNSLDLEKARFNDQIER